MLSISCDSLWACLWSNGWMGNSINRVTTRAAPRRGGMERFDCKFIDNVMYFERNKEGKYVKYEEAKKLKQQLADYEKALNDILDIQGKLSIGVFCRCNPQDQRKRPVSIDRFCFLQGRIFGDMYSTSWVAHFCFW